MIRRQLLAFVGAFVVSAPLAATAGGPIEIGVPVPLSGAAAIYGVPILKGTELAAAELNAKGGVLGRKIEILARDSKANPDEAVRVSRELIIKDDVNFLVGTLTSAEAPAVSTIAKENEIVFIAPSAKLMDLTAPSNLHEFVFRAASTTKIEGRTAAAIVAKWPGIRTVATIAPDYAYGRQAIGYFVAWLKEVRPDIKLVNQQWPKLGEANLTPFITAMMSKHPDAVMCDEYGGDFVTFVKQATPLGFFKSIDNRMIDGAEVGTVDVARALGSGYPFGIWADAYDPVIWAGNPPPGHAAFEQQLEAFMHDQYGSGWAIQGYNAVIALADAVKKAGTADDAKVAEAMLGLTIQTPIGTRTISKINHDFNTGEVWGRMVRNPAYPFAVMSNPEYISPDPYLN